MAGNLLTNDTDVDAGDTKTVTLFKGVAPTGAAIGTTYGTVTVAADGSYTYTLDNTKAATNALTQGQIVTETFAYTMRDTAGATSGSTFTVTVTGTNDAPVAVADAAAVTESGVNPGNTAFAGAPTATGNLLGNDTDVDTGDTRTVTLFNGVAPGGAAVSTTYGSVTIAANGAYTYTLDNAKAATNALGQGQTATDVLTYTIADASGATSTSTLTVTVTGTNDAPVAVADAAAVTEAGAASAGTPTVTGSLLTNDTDVDTSDTKAVTLFNGAAPTGAVLTTTYGTITVASNGTYTYALDNAKAATNALTQGQLVTETFTYTMADAAGATSSSTFTVTITGANDAPVVTASSVRVSEEGLAGANPDTTGNTDTTDLAAATGTVTRSDVDGTIASMALIAPATVYTSNGQAITWSGSGTGTLTGSVGATTIVTATINTAGAYTVTLSGPVDHPDTTSEDNLTLFLGVSATDNNGASTSSVLSVIVEDDSPTYAGTPDAALIENVAGAVASGNLGSFSLGADSGSRSKVSFGSTTATGATVDASGFILATHNDVSGSTTVAKTDFLTYNGFKLKYVTGASGELIAQAQDASQTQAFKVTGSLTTGYQVTMLQTLDNPLVAVANLSNISGGNGGTFTYTDNGNNYQLQVVGTSTGGQATVNTTNSTFGVGNQQSIENVAGNVETLNFSFDSNMTGINVTFTNLSTGEKVDYVARDQNGVIVAQGTALGAATDPTLDLTSFTNGHFNSILFSPQFGTDFKLKLNSFGGTSVHAQQNITFGLAPTDADGDPSLYKAVSLTLDGDNSITSGAAASTLGGGPGNDTLTGGAGNDTLIGGAGNDTLDAAGGNDLLYGGAGNDTLTGGLGADTFRWTLADKGAVGSPAIDTITDFDLTANSDALNLKDLLQGELHTGNTVGNLTQYLHFEKSGTNTIIHISSSGAFTANQNVGAPSALVTSNEDQRIVLTASDVIGAFTTDQAVIVDLLTKGKLFAD